MKLSIRSKLFITLLAATSGVVLSMYVIMQHNFNQGFLRYINQQQQRYYRDFATTLAIEWQQQQSWENITSNKKYWWKLVRTSFAKFRHKFNNQEENTHSPNFPPPRLSHPPFLLDKHKNILFGRKKLFNEDILLHPIIVGTETVGYVGQLPRKKITQHLDIVFAKQQNQAFLFISIFMIIISALATLPIAAQLTKPIRLLTQGTRKLTSGNYQETIPVASKDELGSLSRDFNTLAATLRENEQARKQWVADISHELRTPLSVLKGEVEALQDGINQPTQQAFSSLHMEVEHIHRLINDLYELSMSDIGALSYQKSYIDPVPLLNTTIQTVESLFIDQNIQLQYQPSSHIPNYILGDKDRLQQLFTNILTNSLRYTDAPGHLHINVLQSSTHIHFQFEDSAPSVPDEDIPHLFERLYRVDKSRNRASGGAGLGLSICYNIVQAHDGTITAQTSSLGGLKVMVIFPLARQTFDT